MSIEQLDVVDVLSTDRAGRVMLTVSDHFDWFESVAHQKLLQAKINRYIASVESGEILESYPDAKNRTVAIKIVFKYQPDVKALRFLHRAEDVVNSAGIILLHEVFMEVLEN